MQLATSCQYENETSNTFSLEAYADSLFQGSVDSAKIAGGAILVFQKNQLMLKKSYGYASLELSAPMPEDAQFEIGSVTKQFTAAAILKLVEDKKLSLDDDFTKYLDFDTKGRTITINNLLDHTSGIASFTEISESFIELYNKEYPRDSLVRIVERTDFLFEPGEALIYNNIAYFFLGLIIEKITGEKYEEYLKETFFEPLGMDHTYYCSTTKVVKNKVYGYDYTAEGLQQRSYQNHTWPFAAGSLCSTTADLLIWMEALHKRKIFSEALYQSLITPGELNDGTTLHYAKGLVNFHNFGHKEIGHLGDIRGFMSDTRYFPDDDLYIICLVNTIVPQGTNYFANKITWKLLKKQKYANVALDINTKNLEGKYIGATRGATQSLEVKSLSNSITIQVEGRDKIDTLKIYIGNNTWMKGNNKITIQNNEYRIDQIHPIYGYYILKKED